MRLSPLISRMRILEILSLGETAEMLPEPRNVRTSLPPGPDRSGIPFSYRFTINAQLTASIKTGWSKMVTVFRINRSPSCINANESA
jgi:hypothetical protein